MVMLVVLLFIVEIIIALVAAAAIVAGSIFILRLVAPPLVVRPLPRIDFFDAHPRHVCRGDTVRANWRGDGESGILTATTFFPVGPFYSESIGPSRTSIGSSTFTADAEGGFDVGLELRRRSVPPVTRSVLIHGHSSPNERIELTVPLTFTRDPRPGWVGTRVFSSDPLIDVDDWSLSIHVTGLEYPAAIPRPGVPRPTRDMVRDVIVSWGSLELATLSVDHDSHMHTPEEVTVVGEWKLFVVANPDDGPDTLLQAVTIALIPRCRRV